MSPAAVTPEQFNTFGELLKYLRRRARITQRELAIEVGYSDTQISRMEQDQRLPDLATLTALFVPALQLEQEPAWVTRLLALASAPRVESAPETKAIASPAIPHNLPIQLTSFIGREKEIAELSALLQTHRLITLTGAGGTGKSRLSLQAAKGQLDPFHDGVWFVEFAPVSDPALVPYILANILGLREPAESKSSILEVLVEYLRSRKALLIFDNCEHLIGACARLAESLLQSCKHLSILATSREALGVWGEMTYHVPSLNLPDRITDMESLVKSESGRLYVERVRDSSSDFSLTSNNAPTIAQICRRLDGIPLAIELAAARVKMLAVEQIAQRLDDRFHLLTGGARTALPRHRTLRAMIDWSYDLLSEPEKALFRRLTVFAGGWELEGAEMVCSGTGIESQQVLDLLSQLVNKSLVIVERVENQSRYHMLETIRQYARERLFAENEASSINDRHLDYFVSLAEQAEPELQYSNQLAWLKRLEREFDNIRLALEWSRTSRVLDGLRLGSAIWRFCLRNGYGKELAGKLSLLLTHPDAAPPTSTRAKALGMLSILLIWQNELTRARTMAEESLVIYRQLGDRRGEAASLYALGSTAMVLGDPVCRSVFQESLVLYRTLQDSPGMSEVLTLLGDYYDSILVDDRQAQIYLEESLALSRRRGDAIGMAGALDCLGMIALWTGDFQQARLRFEESLAAQRPLGPPGYVGTLGSLGELSRYEGNYEQGRAYCEEAIQMSKNAGLTIVFLGASTTLGQIALAEGKWEEAASILTDVLRQAAARRTRAIEAVEGLSLLAMQRSHPEQAVRLLGWADAARNAFDFSAKLVERGTLNRHLAKARDQLGDGMFEKAWAEGRTMTMEQAISMALEAANA